MTRGESLRYLLYCDGASRGNPGPAASGAVLIAPDGSVFEQIGRYIGRATNNEAEYRALIFGVEAAVAAGIRDLDIRLDSQLVVRQLNGEYAVRHPQMQVLAAEARKQLARLERFTLRHVPRNENARADALANQALDGALKRPPPPP